MVCFLGQKVKSMLSLGLGLQKHIVGDRVAGVSFCTLSSAQPLAYLVFRRHNHA